MFEPTENSRRFKNIIMITLCLIICGMSIAYAMLANDVLVKNKERYTGNNDTRLWNVGIVSIKEYEKDGNAYSVSAPTNNTISATFNVGLTSPGDSMTYAVKVKNAGRINAKVQSIYISTDYNPNISYRVTNLRVGDKLHVGDEKDIYVKVSFNKYPEKIIKDTKSITIIFNYVQDI